MLAEGEATFHGGSIAPIKDTVKVKALDGDGGAKDDGGKPRDGKGKSKDTGDQKDTKDPKNGLPTRVEGRLKAGTLLVMRLNTAHEARLPGQRCAQGQEALGGGFEGQRRRWKRG